MKKLNQGLALASVAVALTLGTGHLGAQERQGRGNFDPAQMRQRMMDSYKEAMEVKNDDEWKIISERIEKVTTLQRDARLGGFGGFGGNGGRRGRGGEANADANATPRPNPFAAAPNPDAEALQKALEAKASSDELKTKLAKLRESQKEKEAQLAKAQDELRKVLSVRQEATAVMRGLLK